ncbi:MAG: hypothetical protein H6662_18415 [Ardenticatenaceae bacterium]|nr:hypothetical protein [Anaerolineales bacterium]MCB8923565.1 hypothetical protein [Ardenticatenaceae bacterium]MCB8991714.1 hypothetical protein [Ardenticatenaceae bacterium]
MSVETISGEEYSVTYNDNTQSIKFDGSMRLRTSEEYAPINDLLLKAHDATPAESLLTLDFSSLKFLNSSGINIVSRFVIAARKQAHLQLKVIGNQDIYWQQKSLTNLQRLWTAVQIDIQ